MTKPKTGSLADQIASTLRFEIASNFKAGERLPGMHELRKRFDVSINTIGAALDILASAGLVDKRRGSGVYVREGGGRRRMAVVSELDLLDPRISPYWRVLASEVMASLKAAGQLTQLYVGHAEPGRPSDQPTCTHFWEDMEAGRLGGAVLLDLPLSPAWAKRVKNSPIPMVGALTGYSVVTDSGAVTSAAVRHLVAEGRRRLGLIAWHGDKHFRRVVAETGAVTSDAWIRSNLDPSIPGAGWEEFCDIWSAKEGRPDGLIFLDDVLYADAQLAIFEMGVRVPDTLRIALMSSRNASPNLRLPLTLFEFDPAKIAGEYVGLLLDRIEGRIHEPTEVHMPFQRRVVSQAALSK